MRAHAVEATRAPLQAIKYGLLAIGRKFLLDRLYSGSESPPNLVISTGGAGTTFLMRHLEKFIAINDPFDADRIKHLPRLPAGWLDSRRVLFIHAAPADVYQSIRRRGWLRTHGPKLGCLVCQFVWGGLHRRLFERAIRKQIATFHAYRSDQVMLLAYDDIWTRVDDIATFFGIEDDRFARSFPPRRPRTSSGD